MNFDEWLTTTRRLQEELTGVDPAALRGSERAAYLRDQVLAAVVELGEFLQSIYWKPWARHDGVNRRPREEVIEELVDVMHFVANALVCLDVTGAELSQAYRQKQRVNLSRRRGKEYQG